MISCSTSIGRDGKLQLPAGEGRPLSGDGMIHSTTLDGAKNTCFLPAAATSQLNQIVLRFRLNFCVVEFLKNPNPGQADLPGDITLPGSSRRGFPSSSWMSVVAVDLY